MTNKEKVLDFLDFLNTHSGVISTGNAVYNYSELRHAIIDTFEEYANSQIHKIKDSFYDWDKTLISDKADW
jgi:hypothetical protein